jgi:hypothetical protein
MYHKENKGFILLPQYQYCQYFFTFKVFTWCVSVTGFFLTTTSSLMYGSLVISSSSFLRGIFISVLESTGLSADMLVYPLSLGGLLSTLSSSWVTGTSTVLVSVYTSSVDSDLDTFSLSSITGILVSWHSAFHNIIRPPLHSSLVSIVRAVRRYQRIHISSFERYFYTSILFIY